MKRIDTVIVIHFQRGKYLRASCISADATMMTYLSHLLSYSISMVKTPRANTVGSSFTSSSRSLTHRDNTSVHALDLGDREAKTRWSFRVSSYL